jgi:hypothetical protein
MSQTKKFDSLFIVKETLEVLRHEKRFFRLVKDILGNLEIDSVEKGVKEMEKGKDQELMMLWVWK